MRFHWLLPDIKGIPVLMYHRIWPGRQDGLTLTPEQLRAQWLYLKEAGYRTLSMQEFLSISSGQQAKTGKEVLLTFDDGYHNNLTHVYPLLQELGWCATIFIIADTLDGTATPPGEEIDRKLTVAELRSMSRDHIQLGLHGYHHENFSKCTAAEIGEILLQSFKAFEDQGIIFERVLAYPYGARPKENNVLQEMKKILIQQGLKAAFRIGNKPEKMPSADLMEIKRIDIRGEDSLQDFRIKLRKGKLKPF